MRGVPTILAVLALAVCLGCPPGGDSVSPAGATGESRSPVVILVTVDGLAPERLAPFGGDVAVPALAGLADAGRAWPGAITAVPVSRPAVASYLTGLGGDRHGVRDNRVTPLSEEFRTLPQALHEAGYVTAAFPDSSFFSHSSGVLRAFDLADAPQSAGTSPIPWYPLLRPGAELLDNLGRWLDGVPAGTRWFAWFHLSSPLDQQMKVDQPGVELDRPPAADRWRRDVEAVDVLLGRLLARLEDRGELDGATVAVVGTVGDVWSGENRPFGPGFSLDDGAVRVPLFLRLPRDVAIARGADEPVWGPDVTATLAEVAGADLGEAAEGVSLLRPAPGDRLLDVVSFVPRDELGWLPLRSVRSAEATLVDGAGARGAFEWRPASAADDQVRAQRMLRRLSERPDSAPDTVDPADVAAVLAEDDIEVTPVDPAGRPFPDAERRAVVTRALWAGRAGMATQRLDLASAQYSVVAEADPRSLAGRLDPGRLLIGARPQEARALLAAVVADYPGNVEAVHWFAHSEWDASSERTERLLRLVLPHRAWDGDVLYDLACIESMTGDLPAAAEFLDRAIAAGFRSWEHIATDPDLRALRADRRYAEVMRGYGR